MKASEAGDSSGDVVPAPTTSPSVEFDPDNQTIKARQAHGRQASISLQSKLRSTSFRHTGDSATSANIPTLPDGDTAPEIYRKQIQRIDELERENKRLAKEAQDGEARWRKSEEALEELREKSVDDTTRKASSTDADAEIARLRGEIETMRRQQRQSISMPKPTRTGSTSGGDEVEGLRKELENKDGTISDMQLEISRLRTQLSSQTEGCETHGEQIAALQSSLTSTESRFHRVESELGDTKKALSRATEKAVLDGTERTSKDTKIRTLERALEEATNARNEATKKTENLDKKVEAMTKLHREAETRNATKLSTAEASAREANMLKAKVSSLENEVLRLKEARKRAMSGGGDNDGLDELEEENNKKLERRIRELESENFDLKRGVWRDQRMQMQPSGDEGGPGLAGAAEEFDEVDLSSSAVGSRRRSFANSIQQQARHSGFTQVLNSGLAAFRAATISPDSQQKQQTRPRNDSLLEEYDDDAGFDEAAFAHAQREEEARQMVERVREIKRGLKQWTGYRLDLVDARRVGGGGVGVGEIFEV